MNVRELIATVICHPNTSEVVVRVGDALVGDVNPPKESRIREVAARTAVDGQGRERDVVIIYADSGCAAADFVAGTPGFAVPDELIEISRHLWSGVESANPARMGAAAADLRRFIRENSPPAPERPDPRLTNDSRGPLRPNRLTGPDKASY